MIFGRLLQAPFACLLLLNFYAVGTRALATEDCDDDCKNAIEYCQTWDSENPGKTCIYVQGNTCPIEHWKSIKQVNASWLACERVDEASGSFEFDLYRHFMRHFEGKASIAIPSHLHPFIEDHYGIDPEVVRWGQSDDLPETTCIVDCNNIYCNSEEFIGHVKSGYYWSNFGELAFHQLAHVQQCHQLGGSEYYAELWFENLRKDLQLAIINKHSSTKDSLKELAQKLHNIMPLEKEAQKKASAVRATYMGKVWHKRIRCRVFASDKKTLVYEHSELSSRSDCDVKYDSEVSKLIKLEMEKRVAEGGLEPGIYHIAFDRPDIGMGTWLGAFRID